MEQKQITADQTLQRLAAQCSRGEYCTHDVNEKMRRWGLSDDERAQVTARLISDHYVDDTRFCRLFVRDKLKFNKWGRRKIEQALWAKHIDEDTYRPFLDEITAEEYAGILRPMLKNKRKAIRAASEYERDMKLIRYAMSRGFTIDIIKQCIDTDADYTED